MTQLMKDRVRTSLGSSDPGPWSLCTAHYTLLIFVLGSGRGRGREINNYNSCRFLARS